MANSETSVSNLALLEIGVTRVIANFDEDSEEARVCKLMYPQARDQVLEDAEWSFATRRRALAQRTDVTVPSEWGGAFALPADCLIARRLEDGKRTRRPEAALPFTIEDDGEGRRVLYCNEAAPSLVYTTRVTNPELFPPRFVNAVKFRLASLLAMPIVKEGEIRKAMEQLYALALARAAALDAAEETPPAQPEAFYIESMFNGG